MFLAITDFGLNVLGGLLETVIIIVENGRTVRFRKAVAKYFGVILRFLKKGSLLRVVCNDVFICTNHKMATNCNPF